VPVDNRIPHLRQVIFARRSVLDCIDRPHLDHQKDHQRDKHSSIFDRLEWPAVDHQMDHQRDNRLIENVKANFSSLMQSQKSSREESHFQNLKGKKPMFPTPKFALAPDHGHVSICGKYT
jgi:hypothetical protein